MAQAAPRTITDYQQQLGLSSDQTKKISEAVQNYQDRLKTAKNGLTGAENELAKMMEKRAPLPTIRGQLEKAENLRMQCRLLDLQTSRQVREILTAQQWQQWQTIKLQGKARNPR